MISLIFTHGASERTSSGTLQPTQYGQPRMILWWIKKDFRVSDNPALSHALQANEPVLGIFILEPSAMQALETSARHVDAQLQAFKHLLQVVRASGGECCLIHDKVISALDRLKDLAPLLSSIVSHEEIGLLRTYERDEAVQRWCDKHEVIWTELAQTGVIRRLRNRDKRTELWRGDFLASCPISTYAAILSERVGFLG